MSLPDINIDDRNFNQLFVNLRSQIPNDLSDHNTSDPNIMLLELFCWLGDMALYRMNRISETRQEHLIDLLIESPEPVTVQVKFNITFDNARTEPLLIPAGTRLATIFTDGRRSEFETLVDLVMEVPLVGPPFDPQTGSVNAREYRAVKNTTLGVSNGSAHQSFLLEPSPRELELDARQPIPILSDYTNVTDTYNPNPLVRAYTGSLSNISGALSGATGIHQIRFNGALVEEIYFLTFVPGTMTITRSDGLAEASVVGPLPIAVGEIETIAFPGFDVEIDINEQFDKTVPITNGINTAVVTGGTGAIDPASLRLVGASGSLKSLSSDAVGFAAFSATEPMNLSVAEGFNGEVIGAVGSHQVTLRDAQDNHLIIAFDITAAFDGNETSAVLTLADLHNVILFGGEYWATKHSLLTEESKVDPLSSRQPQHVQLDSLTGQLLFGDQKFGQIPIEGARLVCDKYQVLGGSAGLIESGEIQYLLTDFSGALLPGESLSVNNDENDAIGGRFFYTSASRHAEGLQEFSQPFRLVTQSDFEFFLPQQFNEYQLLAGRPERIARVIAVMNRKANEDPQLEFPGNIILVVLRELNAVEQLVLADPGVLLSDKQTMLELDTSNQLARRLLGFLDERRLITTKIELIPPKLIAIEIEAVVAIQGERNESAMANEIRSRLSEYLDPVMGGEDGRGWRVGRNIYSSELHQVINQIEGVSHVSTLTLTPASPGQDITVEMDQIPIVNVLTIATFKS